MFWCAAQERNILTGIYVRNRPKGNLLAVHANSFAGSVLPNLCQYPSGKITHLTVPERLLASSMADIPKPNRLRNFAQSDYLLRFTQHYAPRHIDEHRRTHT